MISLRPYQQFGLRRASARLRAGVRRILLVLPTGGGKTVIAAHICSSGVRQGKRLVFVAHRRELIKQAWCKLVRNGLDPRLVGVVMSGTSTKLCDDVAKPPGELKDEHLWAQWARWRPGAPVQVASIDTLRGMAKWDADVLIIDEAHRALCRSYLDLCDSFPRAVIIGLTATPYRADNRGLGELFEDLVQVATYADLIADGWIVDPDIHSVGGSDLPDLSQVKVKRSGDYDEHQLAQAVDKPRLVGKVVSHWLEHAGGVRTVIFCASVAHSKHVRDELVSAGIPAEHLDAHTPAECPHVDLCDCYARSAILRRLKFGVTRIVCNVDVLTEGWDMPSVKCAALLRPTLSRRVYMQQGGRILRPFESQRAILLDHAGLFERFGPVTRDVEHSLDPPKAKRAKVTSVANCKACHAAYEPPARVCPSCGEPIGEERDGEGRGLPEEVDGKLVLVHRGGSAPVIDERRAYWDALCASRGGHGPGWVYITWQNRFQAKPPRGWTVPLTDEELLAKAQDDAPKKARLREIMQEAQLKGWKQGAVGMRFKAEFDHFPPGAWVEECRASLPSILSMAGVQ